MGTVNTLVLSHYSDEAVASVGAANQLMGMIFTFYTVISTGPVFSSATVSAPDRRKRPPTPFTSLFLQPGAQSCGRRRPFPVRPQIYGNDAA